MPNGFEHITRPQAGAEVWRMELADRLPRMAGGWHHRALNRRVRNAEVLVRVYPEDLRDLERIGKAWGCTPGAAAWLILRERLAEWRRVAPERRSWCRRPTS